MSHTCLITHVTLHLSSPSLFSMSLSLSLFHTNTHSHHTHKLFTFLSRSPSLTVCFSPKPGSISVLHCLDRRALINMAILFSGPVGDSERESGQARGWPNGCQSLFLSTMDSPEKKSLGEVVHRKRWDINLQLHPNPLHNCRLEAQK